MSLEELNEIVAELRSITSSAKRSFTKDESNNLWNQMGLDEKRYDRTQFWLGLNVELEHGTKGAWNITNNDPIMTAKIALVHLDEKRNYYSLLEKYVDNE